MNRGRRNVVGVAEVKDKYEDDHAVFMLHSMFNQFSKVEVGKIYDISGKDFFTAMEQLLQKQKATKTSPRVAQLPNQQQNLGNRNESPPVQPHTINFQSPRADFNYEAIVKWKEFDLQNAVHLRILKDQDDPISMEPLLENGMEGRDKVVQLPCATKKMRCNFLRNSIIQCFQAKPECPVCKTFYPLPGKQPTGSMRVTHAPNNDCESFEGDGSIFIQFNFPRGVQGPNHLNPGTPYGGVTRTAYLPHIEEGKKALILLEEAFRRGELFTIGKSLTTGANGVITYGSIHLKTSLRGGTTSHGWPDRTYFQRLRDECAAKMIFDPEIQRDMNKARAKKQFKQII